MSMKLAKMHYKSICQEIDQSIYAIIDWKSCSGVLKIIELLQVV